MPSSPLAWFLVAAILLVPPASIVGLVLWAPRLANRPGVPRFAARVVYGLAALGGLAIAAGLGLGVVTATSAVAGDATEPSEKARHLAEGISEVMNCGALGLLVAGVAAGWIVFWTWRTEGSPEP
jgi:hypothetical protein